MAYSSLSIKELIVDISDNKYFLPAIQRKFVWGEDRICKLFNSIMRDYPIGTFLFWDLPKSKANQYTFYEFLKNYHERDSKNELVRRDFTREVRGVLDGQQRLSSIYIALQGVYCTRKKYAKWADDDAYPERQFYMNLLGEDNEYEFKFLTEQKVNSAETKYFYLVRNALNKSENSDPDELLDELIKENPEKADLLEENRKQARKNINRLLKKLNDRQLVSYFRIIDKDLDDILDIFVRVNSGGTVLSKSDLLFSTLVAHWEDGRDQVERLIDDMNGEDGTFNFGTDFLMRTCLFLVDAPMTFKVHTFDRANIEKIKNNWSRIRIALIQTTKLLNDFGFNKKRLSSNYAATPVAYYLFKGGVINDKTKSELRKLVVQSLLKRVYSGQADTVLASLREGLRDKDSENLLGYSLKHTCFDFDMYKIIRLPSGKKLSVDAEDVDHFLEHKKGVFTFLLLSALYPHLKLEQISFHQDHMHPHSKFKSDDLASAGLSEVEISLWQDLRDQLPNLQLLEGIENTKKQATALIKWVGENEVAEAHYRQLNYIAQNQSLEFMEFRAFFESRKLILRKKLHQLFDIPQVVEAVVIEEVV